MSMSDLPFVLNIHCLSFATLELVMSANIFLRGQRPTQQNKITKQGWLGGCENFMCISNILLGRA